MQKPSSMAPLIACPMRGLVRADLEPNCCQIRSVGADTLCAFLFPHPPDLLDVDSTTTQPKS